VKQAFWEGAWVVKPQGLNEESRLVLGMGGGPLPGLSPGVAVPEVGRVRGR
jgi:hypothetical protein